MGVPLVFLVLPTTFAKKVSYLLEKVMMKKKMEWKRKVKIGVY